MLDNGQRVSYFRFYRFILLSSRKLVYTKRKQYMDLFLQGMQCMILYLLVDIACLLDYLYIGDSDDFMCVMDMRIELLPRLLNFPGES